MTSKPRLPDFKNLSLPESPNYYLVAREGLCNAEVDEESKVYSLSVLELIKCWQDSISQQPRTKLETMAPNHQYTYTQKTKYFGFTDDITVQFYELTENSSTLVIYSRSRVGYFDFWANKIRVKSWLRDLDKSIAS